MPAPLVAVVPLGRDEVVDPALTGDGGRCAVAGCCARGRLRRRSEAADEWLLVESASLCDDGTGGASHDQQQHHQDGRPGSGLWSIRSIKLSGWSAAGAQFRSQRQAEGLEVALRHRQAAPIGDPLSQLTRFTEQLVGLGMPVGDELPGALFMQRPGLARLSSMSRSAAPTATCSERSSCIHRPSSASSIASARASRRDSSQRPSRSSRCTRPHSASISSLIDAGSRRPWAISVKRPTTRSTLALTSEASPTTPSSDSAVVRNGSCSRRPCASACASGSDPSRPTAGTIGCASAGGTSPPSTATIAVPAGSPSTRA